MPGQRYRGGADTAVPAQAERLRQCLAACTSDAQITHDGGTGFAVDADPQPVEDARIRQGFLEDSNVDPVFEITRMIEIQRAYELGQSFLDREDQRIRNAITSMTR